MWAWSLAAGLAGISVGLYFGRLVAAVIVNWESSDVAVKSWMALVTFVFGGGALGSTVLFQLLSEPGTNHGAFYLGGWALGAIYAFFQPRLPPRYTLETVTNVVEMSERLRDSLPDPERRALLIATTFAPPKSIERDAHLNEEQFAKALEEATDAVASENGENDK